SNPRYVSMSGWCRVDGGGVGYPGATIEQEVHSDRPTAPRAHPESATDAAAPGSRASRTGARSSGTRAVPRATARAPATPATRHSSAAVVAGGFGGMRPASGLSEPGGEGHFGDEGSGVAGARTDR